MLPFQPLFGQDLNKNSFKVSFRTLPNIAQKISGHNSTVLKAEQERVDLEINGPPKMCNCQKYDCPVNGKCLTVDSCYQAVVTRDDNQHQECYVGLSGTTFKKRWSNHLSNFTSTANRGTRLSTYIKKLNSEKVKHNIKWRILEQSKQFSPSTKICQLCTLEKWYIIFKPELASLNKRNELGMPCLHRVNKLL